MLSSWSNVINSVKFLTDIRHQSVNRSVALKNITLLNAITEREIEENPGGKYFKSLRNFNRRLQQEIQAWIIQMIIKIKCNK